MKLTNLNFIRRSNFTSKAKIFNTRNKFYFCTSDDKKYPNIIKKMFQLNILQKKLPCFEVYSSQIEILNAPFDFYLAIIVAYLLII